MFYVIDKHGEKVVLTSRFAHEKDRNEINIFNDNKFFNKDVINDLIESKNSVFFDLDEVTYEYKILSCNIESVYYSFKYSNDIDYRKLYESPSMKNKRLETEKSRLLEQANAIEYEKSDTEYYYFLRRNSLYENNYNIKRNGRFVFYNKITNKHDFSYICNKIARVMRKINDPCIDNCRIARCNNEIDLKIYKEIQNSGCCGFYDEKWTNKVTGNSYLFGFNYGH